MPANANRPLATWAADTLHPDVAIVCNREVPDPLVLCARSTLPHPVPRFPKCNTELDLHVLRAAVWHGVVYGVKVRAQP